MNLRTRQSARRLASLGLAMVAVSAAMAFADCNRAVRPTETLAPAVTPVRTDASVTLGDPGLDGMFDRYAGLHRDAVGYALVDVVESPVYANAVGTESSPLTR